MKQTPQKIIKQIFDIVKFRGILEFSRKLSS